MPPARARREFASGAFTRVPMGRQTVAVRPGSEWVRPPGKMAALMGRWTHVARLRTGPAPRGEAAGTRAGLRGRRPPRHRARHRRDDNALQRRVRRAAETATLARTRAARAA